MLGLFNVAAYKLGPCLYVTCKPYCPGYRGSRIGKIQKDEADTRGKW